MRNLAGHKVLLILHNPGGTCRNIYRRKQLYPPALQIYWCRFSWVSCRSWIATSSCISSGIWCAFYLGTLISPANSHFTNWWSAEGTYSLTWATNHGVGGCLAFMKFLKFVFGTGGGLNLEQKNPHTHIWLWIKLRTCWNHQVPLL
jgi:hypothetical protein